MISYCKPITFKSKDGYIYKGLLFEAQNSDTTVIHIHGSCGNFLSFTALPDVVDEYVKAGFNVLSFNLKGHDCLAEGLWDSGALEYVGGSISDFDECISDIECAIEYCLTFSKKIILQGHSMGCERVVTYQLATKKYYDTILISPCDAYRLQADYISPMSMVDLVSGLKQINGNPLLIKEYGINSNGEKYIIPIFKDALLSILEGNAMKVFREDEQLDYLIPVRCACCIGLNDKLQTLDAKKMFKMIKPHFDKFESYAFNTNHEFDNAGYELGRVLSNWIMEL